MVAEEGFERFDLRVMGPTSYQTALLRDVCPVAVGLYTVGLLGLEPINTELFTILSSCVFRFKFSF